MSLDIKIKSDDEEHAKDAEKVKGGGLNSTIGCQSKLTDCSVDRVKAGPERCGND